MSKSITESITDAQKARQTGQPRALLRDIINNKLISEAKNMKTMEDIQANIDDEVQGILRQKDIDRSPLRSVHPPNPMFIENAAADDEVQGILRQKDIDRSPLRPAYPYNPDKPTMMEWNQNAVDDDEVNQYTKKILSRTQLGRQVRRKSGGCTDRQKGIAAQIRTFTNGELREELNKIVHSGDSTSSRTHHPSNEYIDLSNNFDSKAEAVINRGIDFIKNSDNIKYKQKNKILNGIVQNNSTIANATTMYNKPTTTLVTPRISFKDITSNRITPTVKSRRSRRSRSRRNKSRSRSRSRSRRSRRSRS